MRTILGRRTWFGSWLNARLSGCWARVVGRTRAWLAIARRSRAWLAITRWAGSGLAVAWRARARLTVARWACARLSGGWSIARLTGLDRLRCRRTVAGGTSGWRAIAWVARVMRRRTVDGWAIGVGRAVVGRAIAPVAAVSGIVGVVGWAGVIPVGGWTIAADPDSSPWAAIVVDAVTPSPSPASPAPWLVVGDEESDAYAYSEGDE